MVKKRQRMLAGFDDDGALLADSRSAPPSPPEPSGATTDEAEASDDGPPGEKTVYVIDAFSLIFQVFHAMPEMTGVESEPIGAVHGFTRDVLNLIDKEHPDYLFCAFDLPGGTFRDEAYPAYKANRDEMPTDLQPQIKKVCQMLKAMGVPILACEGYEADDVLATVARQAEQRGMNCLLVTADKDCRQLITDRVRLYNIRKGQVYDKRALLEDWGIRPDQVVDFQALVGDSSDNVPGIPMIGPKFAKELLERYGTLESVLDHADEVSGNKRRENLKNGRETALLSRKLVRLVDDVPLEVNWEAGRVGQMDFKRVRDQCLEFGLRRIASRIAKNIDEEPVSPALATDYRTVATVEQFEQFVAELEKQKRISVDTETTSTNPRWAEIVGYSFSWQPGQGWYIPVRSPAGDPKLDAELVRDALKPALENPEIEKVGQNLKYDMIVLRGVGIRLRGIAFDTMVADYLIAPGERSHGIDSLAERYLGHTACKIKDLIGTGKRQKRMDEIPVARVAPYAAEDADLPLRLVDPLAERLDQAGLTSLFRDLEIPLIDVLAELEFNGIRVDVERLRELGRRFQDKMGELAKEIYELAGGPFNIDSRIQLGHVLFEKLGLPVVKKTKTGPSTDASVLNELAPQHPLPAKILQYRQFAKLNSTYVDSLIELVHSETGRVHTSFKQDVAATGRLSSTDPNLQNIPVRTAEGRAIRSAFLPGYEGWRLLGADYSQIELRVLAHFSGDETLQQAFIEDRDIHAQVASQVYGVPLDQVTPEMRRAAKTVNFGVIYGQSAFGLAKALGIGKGAAADFIEAYFAKYPGVDEFMLKTLAECRQRGYVSTILGRRRTVQGVRDLSSLGGSRQRNLPERIAINTVIQGSAADLIKLAMIQVARRLRQDGLRARMLLQIHDELVFEVPPDEITLLARLVSEEMCLVHKLDVPLKVDVKVGENWAECEALSKAD